MPRPAGRCNLVRSILLILPIVQLTAIYTAASQTPPPGDVSHQGFGGIWVLNPDRGDLAHPDTAAATPQQGRGGRGGGFSGRMGRGGQGRAYGGDEAQREDDVAHRQAVMNYVRTASDASKQLTIVVRDDSVNITDIDGRVQTLRTDDKKTESRAENGLIKITTKNHWDGDSLESEVDIENGPKIVYSFGLSPGGTELRLSTTVNGQGQPRNLVRFYERPVESR
jgi:hypothetical protein